ncbi:MAG: phosphodiesterase [Marinobacterium sp.]|nr:phosphodiesterase [Marinobacterium sp.]
MKLIHLTDTHLTAPGETLYGTSPAQRLRACVASINAEHSDAELCVITGDLAHKGDPKAYTELAEILNGLNMPVQLLIGNHDDRDSVSQQFPQLQRDRYGFVQSTLQSRIGTFIYMDTVRADSHAGAYCEQRQQWLGQQLEQARGDVFLFMHHAPFDSGIPVMDELGIQTEDAQALKMMIQGHGRVRHLFFGHYHRPMHGSWAGCSFSTLRGMNHQIVLDLHNNDHYRFNHEPPTYAIALLSGDSVVVHNHDFMDNSVVFDPSQDPAWADCARPN